MADPRDLTLPDADPEGLDALLRRCIQCGLCLPACATWLATGDETMSPRGRLLLVGDLLADPSLAGADPSWRQALDTCIGCQACSAVCPSGVPFSLLESAVATAHAAGRAPAGRASIPAALVARLDDPLRLRWCGAAASLGRSLLRLALGPRWRRRAQGKRVLGSAARLFGSVPGGPRADRALIAQLDALAGGRRTPPGRPVRQAAAVQRLIWFAGCANEGLLPDSSRRLRELLVWAGAELVDDPGTACCGALAAHAGHRARADRLQACNLAAWKGGDGAAAIVTEASGCGAAIAAYGDRLPLPQVDAMVWLASSARPAFGSVPLKVALHDPCHARHAQGIIDEPRALLRGIPGLTLLEPDEPDVCCGSGGIWALGHRDLSMAVGVRKARVLAATGADLIVTANPGCLGQIADGLATLPNPAPPILPLGDLLWYAAVRA